MIKNELSFGKARKETETVTANPTIYCTTREAAQMLGVSLRTVQLWTESGLLEAWKTEGGHRRITRASVQRLLAGEPPAEAAASPDAAVAPARATAREPGGLERIRVLVVEDDVVLMKLYRNVIATWGLPIDVITANNGVEGLIRVGRDMPDLMISDLSMPGMDGFQLIRNLSISSFREGMTIVVVTGLTAEDIAERGGLPADVAVFPKPVPFQRLRAIAEGLLARRAAYL